ncbi:MAG: hypothetical protein DRJ03_01680 [Chloroflexi bacterium]|nr:MAG: hypothetical protein DRJ03_01680 [Chloroflexota bacterium]
MHKINLRWYLEIDGEQSGQWRQGPATLDDWGEAMRQQQMAQERMDAEIERWTDEYWRQMAECEGMPDLEF